jgi:hypothetical protein
MLWVPQKKIAMAVKTNAGHLGRKKIKAIAFELLNIIVHPYE